jgi:uncharacterized coiled-coil protein SlyX
MSSERLAARRMQLAAGSLPSPVNGGQCALDVPACAAMKEAAEHEERFTVLEIKAAYLEKLTLELNQVVISQARLIDDLQLRLARLERQQQASAEDRDMPQERPPHY